MEIDEVEERAARELAGVPDWIWDGETPPVPVDHIADSHYGLHVREVEDLRAAPGMPALPASQALSGLLLPSRAEIWISAPEARSWESRKRFTIGHELGHWCLHRAGEVIWCRSHSVLEDERWPERRASRPAPQEREANEFAAALLMPAPLVERHHERLRRSDPERCFEQLCQLFGASAAAMARRLARLI